MHSNCIDEFGRCYSWQKRTRHENQRIILSSVKYIQFAQPNVTINIRQMWVIKSSRRANLSALFKGIIQFHIIIICICICTALFTGCWDSLFFLFSSFVSLFFLFDFYSQKHSSENCSNGRAFLFRMSDEKCVHTLRSKWTFTWS